MQWIISKSWYFDVASIFFVWLHLLESDVQLWTPHVILRGFA